MSIFEARINHCAEYWIATYFYDDHLPLGVACQRGKALLFEIRETAVTIRANHCWMEESSPV